jgi:uncharacterized membrane protein
MRRRAFKFFVPLAASIALAALVTKSLSDLPCTRLNGSDTLTIKLNDLAAGTVRAFCYRDVAGRKLRFLLARDVRGRVHAVFDACGQCYKFHKGYTYSGHYLICRLCGNRYPIVDMDRGKASCVPVQFKSRNEHGAAKIKVADVETGKWLF